MTSEVHALVGAYALDAVDDLERAAFDRHLRECEDCRAEVAELQATAARLADGAWSVPPPRLRDNVLAAIATTRQIAPAPAKPIPARRSGPLRLRLTAAAAAVVAAVAAGTAVFVVEDQRVRHERALAESVARSGSPRAHAILSAGDLVVREQTLTVGGQVIVASSRSENAGVILLAAAGAPAAGQVYETWTVSAQGPVPVGTTRPGRASIVQVVEGLPQSSAVGVTVEPAGGSTRPTLPMVGNLKVL